MKHKKTNTTIFFIPTLKLQKELLEEHNFINGYIDDEDSLKDIYDNCVLLLFKPENIEKFREYLENEYENNSNLITDYNKENEYIVLVYSLNSKYKDDFEIIKQGRYSQTSKEFQELFPKVVKLQVNGFHRDELALQVRIFKKSPDLVEFWEKKLGIQWNESYEVWEGFDLEKETLNINNLEYYE